MNHGPNFSSSFLLTQTALNPSSGAKHLRAEATVGTGLYEKDVK